MCDDRWKMVRLVGRWGFLKWIWGVEVCVEGEGYIEWMKQKRMG